MLSRITTSAKLLSHLAASKFNMSRRFGRTGAELMAYGLALREYLEIGSAIREHCVVVSGEAVSLIPEPLHFRSRAIAGQLVSLDHSCHSKPDCPRPV